MSRQLREDLKYVRLGGNVVAHPTYFKSRSTGFMGLHAFEEPEHPHLLRPPMISDPHLYRVNLDLFWSLTDNILPISYTDAWMYVGPNDPID